MDTGSECGLKTNEEIIEELTKDLESSCIRVDENCSSAKKNGKSDDDSNDLPKETDKHMETNSKGDDSCKTQVPHDLDGNPPQDFVDEQLLKDREIGLTETEKQSLRDQAEKLKNQGNQLFKNEEYMEAISTYTEGIQTCPLAYAKERSILYANRAAAKSKCLEKESAIADCTKAIELNPTYTKVISRRGQLYKETEKLDNALEDFKTLSSLDPDNAEWRHEIRKLGQLIEERDEKLKIEMLGQLKDLGNMVLKPFGLSTNNFELEKNPESGGYSVKFKQNPS
ncbi:tetratricopeptide repeat domain 1 [Lasioglossum baleicum]|uniref:tetratricopeptide repeat domain 1 n=1 Tax=Lasioglossum baleicum TaxID=434251 RepID=UPI003FCC4440